MYKNLKEFIEILEKNNELIRIQEYVNPVLEIAEITDRISKTTKGGKALLFENTGTNFPVLTNAFGSDKRMALSLNVNNLDDIATNLNNFITELTKPKNNFSEKLSALSSLKQIASYIPKTVKSAECQEIIIKNPDLSILPVLKTWPKDAGRFVTLPLVNTIDPNTGIRNLGMYRLQIFDKNTTGMHWHKHKVGARHYNEYKKLGKKMPIAVALGGDPVYTYAATAPLPDHIDEYILAGYLRKKAVKLVKCITQDIEIPADADIIIEGYVDPSEELIWEGPFGDHTGFYSLADYYPKFHVTCITHKKEAIYPATLVGIPPQEDVYFAKATEKLFLPLLQKSIAPEITDMHLPESGVAHNFTIIKINSQYEGHALKVMNSLWGNGQMAFNKCLFITDDNSVDITDYKQLAQKSLEYFNPEEDIYYAKGPMDVLDHSSEKFTLGSKIGFDFSYKNRTKTEENNLEFDEKLLLKKFKEIREITSLLNEKIPILIVSIEKNQKILNLSEKIIEKINLSSFKIIIFVDEQFKTNDLYTISWLVGSNIAPLRDTKVQKSAKFNNSILSIDATSKNKEIDNFDREWPEIVEMDEETIKNINKNWEKLKIGTLISSPSLKFKL